MGFRIVVLKIFVIGQAKGRIFGNITRQARDVWSTLQNEKLVIVSDTLGEAKTEFEYFSIIV